MNVYWYVYWYVSRRVCPFPGPALGVVGDFQQHRAGQPGGQGPSPLRRLHLEGVGFGPVDRDDDVRHGRPLVRGAFAVGWRLHDASQADTVADGEVGKPCLRCAFQAPVGASHHVVGRFADGGGCSGDEARRHGRLSFGCMTSGWFGCTLFG